MTADGIIRFLADNAAAAPTWTDLLEAVANGRVAAAALATADERLQGLAGFETASWTDKPPPDINAVTEAFMASDADPDRLDHPAKPLVDAWTSDADGEREHGRLHLHRADPGDWCATLARVMDVADDEAPTPAELASLPMTKAQRAEVGHHVLQCVRLAKPDWAHVARAAGPTPRTPTDAEIDAMDPDAAEGVRYLLATAELGPQAWIEGERDGETQRLYFDAPTLHRLWQRATTAALDAKPPQPTPDHPLGPWFEAWPSRPRPVERNARPDPLFPSAVIVARRPDDPNIARLGFAPPGHVRDGAYLPGLAPEDTDDVGIASLPAELWRIGGGTLARKGRGAPLAKRLFVNALLDAPTRPGSHQLPPIPVRDLLRAVYGGRIRPERHFPAVIDALAEIDTVRLPVAMLAWRHVGVTGAPSHIDAEIVLTVNHPPGLGRGAIMDRRALMLAGNVSSVAYRLALSLGVHWSRPGRLRSKPRGGRTWFQIRKRSRYPRVSDKLLVAMAFPTGAYRAQPKRTLDRATDALRFLAEVGYVDPDSLRDRRLMPGPTWSGWGET